MAVADDHRTGYSAVFLLAAIAVAAPVLAQDAGADALLRILAAAIFDDDGVDPLQIQKVREHETGGSRANNPDLRSQ